MNFNIITTMNIPPLTEISLIIKEEKIDDPEYLTNMIEKCKLLEKNENLKMKK